MKQIANWKQALMVIFGVVIMLTLGYREGLAQSVAAQQVHADVAHCTTQGN